MVLRAAHRATAGELPGHPRDGNEAARCWITGSAAWVAALIMMALADVLTRLAVIYVRGRRLTATSAPSRPATPVGAGA